jgi:hypothetical protein
MLRESFFLLGKSRPLIFLIIYALLVTPVVCHMLNTSEPNDIKDIKRIMSSGNAADDLIIKPRSMTETYLSLGVLAFGLILVIFIVIVGFKKNTGWNQESTRVFAISVIVTAGLFLITAGYSDRQIAPMFGLLGTIVGYLLGKSPPGEHGPNTGT